jgi:hypothetical protein
MGLHLARGHWRALAASVAGTSHVRKGEPCADACAVRVFSASARKPLLVAVAADGAGSAARASEGARLACASILEQAELWVNGSPRLAGARPLRRARRPSRDRDLSRFGRDEVARFVAAARARVVATARRLGLDSREFSCTLLVALVDEAGAVFFQIGDGAIVYADGDGRYRPALWPQSGEYANCTWFLTDEDAPRRAQAAHVSGVHELALLTDGLQSLALRFVSREAHGPFFAPMFERLRAEGAARPRKLAVELRRFLESDSVNRRTDDDKTLVLATRLAAARNGARPEG